MAKKLERGKKFTVVLEENSSTGSSWFVIPNEDVVKLVKSEERQSESQKMATDSGMVGVPHERVFTFQAVGSGTFEIVLKTPWDNKVLQVKSIELKVAGGKDEQQLSMPMWKVAASVVAGYFAAKILLG